MRKKIKYFTAVKLIFAIYGSLFAVG